MAEPFLSEIRIFSFNFPPKGWALCNGQLLPINQNQALFSLLGTTYGGNGQTNFALPNLQGRAPISFGSGFNLGEAGGEIAHTVTMSEMPTHTHFTTQNMAVVGPNSNATQGVPTGNYWANDGKANFTTGASNAVMGPTAVTNVGGNQAHTNMQPYLVLNFCIALQGIFPSQT
ncbi:MAG TPA: tail fiber protein [Pyrinomonadaceae bacterium]|jgi:microcystin-dependent protein|nr:tail fiber protein [Pyrinomonadaceae bacterium]